MIKFLVVTNGVCIGVNLTLLFSAAGSFSTIIILAANIAVGAVALTQLEAKV